MKLKCRQPLLPATLPLVIATLLAVISAEALAQPRYRPARPTISPWLALTDRSTRRTGSLPAYFRLVRPQQDQRAFDRAQALAVSKLSLVDEQPTTTATGTGSVFNNRSHFFPAARSRRPGQRLNQR